MPFAGKIKLYLYTMWDSIEYYILFPKCVKSITWFCVTSKTKLSPQHMVLFGNSSNEQSWFGNAKNWEIET